jgi:hypothetical protein
VHKGDIKDDDDDGNNNNNNNNSKGGKIEEKIEVVGRRGSRCQHLPDDLEEKSGYCILKAEALDRTVWSTRFAGGCGLVFKTKTQ